MRPLATFLQAPRRGGRVPVDLRIVMKSDTVTMNNMVTGNIGLGDFEIVKVLGTGGFS